MDSQGRRGDFQQRHVVGSLGFLLLIAGLLVLVVGGCGETAQPQAQTDLGDAITAAEVAAEDAEHGVDPVVQTGAPAPPSADNPAAFISLCANCHDSLDRPLAWRSERKLVFKHEAHFAKGIRCSACHKGFPHKPGRIEHVPVETCFECHGTTHGNQGVLAPTACSTCHTPDIPKVTADHSQKTWLLQPGSGVARHSRTALQRRLYCKMCHEGSFCDDCHKMEMPHPEGWMQGGHGQQAKSSKTACLKCHESMNFCNDCHHESLPKLPDWGSQHKQVVVAQGTGACFKCHTKPEEFCSPCHVKTGKQRGVLGE
ncbi:MAG: hypothetical protein M1274_14965 [Actinobacteria bacterium]|nr:hypothetical protein [Actinomycetota bacterium]